MAARRLTERLRRGFTVLEVIVALAIMAVMIAVLVPSLTTRVNQAQTSNLQSSLNNIITAINNYHTNVGRYPQKLEQLTISIDISSLDICGSSTAATVAAKWRGPYLALFLNTRGVQMGDYLANNLLVRTPSFSTTPGRLDITVSNVRSADWIALNEAVDGVSTTVPVLSANGSDTAGTVRWDASTTQLSYGMVIRGC